MQYAQQIPFSIRGVDVGVISYEEVGCVSALMVEHHMLITISMNHETRRQNNSIMFVSVCTLQCVGGCILLSLF